MGPEGGLLDVVELARGRRVEEVNEREGQFTVFIMTLALAFPRGQAQRTQCTQK